MYNTQHTALKGRRFESIEAQNEFLEHWETKWAAPRIHGNTRRQVQAMFEEERPHLQALPLTSMQYFTEQQRTVCDDTCIRVEHSSYAARPARIGTKVLVRIFDCHLEIRDPTTKALLRTHMKAERPGTVVLPEDERLFNPSRETRLLLRRARAIGPAAQRRSELLFSVEGRVGQRKLWGIVGLAERLPRRFVDTACERALDEGIHSFKHVKLTPNIWSHRRWPASMRSPPRWPQVEEFEVAIRDGTWCHWHLRILGRGRRNLPRVRACAAAARPCSGCRRQPAGKAG